MFIVWIIASVVVVVVTMLNIVSLVVSFVLLIVSTAEVGPVPTRLSLLVVFQVCRMSLTLFASSSSPLITKNDKKQYAHNQ